MLTALAVTVLLDTEVTNMPVVFAGAGKLKETAPLVPFSTTIGALLAPTAPEMEFMLLVGLLMPEALPLCVMLPAPPAESVTDVLPVSEKPLNAMAPLLYVLLDVSTVEREIIGAEMLPASKIPALTPLTLPGFTNKENAEPEPVKVAALSVTVPVEMLVTKLPADDPDPPADAVRLIGPAEPFSITIGVPLLPTLPLTELRRIVGLEMVKPLPLCVTFPVPPAETVTEVEPVSILLPRLTVPLLLVLVGATVLSTMLGAEMLPARVMPALLPPVLLAVTCNW